MLHKYANEDVSLGSWLIGLDVMHVDDRNICCGTPPGKIYDHYCCCSIRFFRRPIEISLVVYWVTKYLIFEFVPLGL